MMRNLMSCLSHHIPSQDIAYAFATAQMTRAYDFSTLWNVSGKEA